MSEKKSWDVQAKPRRVAPPAPAPAAPPRAAREPVRAAPVRVREQREAPAPAARVVRTAPKRAPQPLGALRERRKKKRRFVRYLFLFVLILLIAGAFYALWMPAFRIQTVSANGPDADNAKTIASMKLVGTYGYIVPRNSVFFIPKSKIRSAILDAAPDVSAVSLVRTSFSSLEVRTTPRAASFVWCGTTVDTPFPNGACFDADIEGLLFKAAEGTTTTSSSTEPNMAQSDGSYVRVFSALDRDVADGQSPLRAHVVSSSRIPDALKFVGAVRGLGAPVSALAIRGDEADLWIGGPTRITYVLGHEEEAAALAASALPTLKLTDGSIQYVDLRFPGKAYIKRYGE